MVQIALCTNVQYTSHYMSENARISNWFNEASVQNVQNQRKKLYNVNKKNDKRKTRNSVIFSVIFVMFQIVSPNVSHCSISSEKRAHKRQQQQEKPKSVPNYAFALSARNQFFNYNVADFRKNYFKLYKHETKL